MAQDRKDALLLERQGSILLCCKPLFDGSISYCNSKSMVDIFVGLDSFIGEYKFLAAPYPKDIRAHR